MSQMAGRDFNTFGVFVPPVMGDFVTLTAARGGIVQFNGPLFVTYALGAAGCLFTDAYQT